MFALVFLKKTGTILSKKNYLRLRLLPPPKLDLFFPHGLLLTLWENKVNFREVNHFANLGQVLIWFIDTLLRRFEKDAGKQQTKQQREQSPPNFKTSCFFLSCPWNQETKGVFVCFASNLKKKKHNAESMGKPFKKLPVEQTAEKQQNSSLTDKLFLRWKWRHSFVDVLAKKKKHYNFCLRRKSFLLRKLIWWASMAIFTTHMKPPLDRCKLCLARCWILKERFFKLMIIIVFF